MSKQADTFLHGEGLSWLNRNIDKLNENGDPVMEAIILSKIAPRSVLEIGCSNGWRLKNLEKKFHCGTTGVEPAQIGTGNILRGTADKLPIRQLKFDLVIYGWCLYLCDREDLFNIAAEGDRVLQEDGYLIVHDFHSTVAYRRPYKHKDGLFSFKYDHALLWLANPSYSLFRRYVHGTGEDQTAVTILQKNSTKGWPLHETR